MTAPAQASEKIRSKCRPWSSQPAPSRRRQPSPIPSFFYGWPLTDIPTGKEIVQAMRPFLLAMVEDQFSYTTINRHTGNLWLLGGEIISRVNADPELKRLDGKRLILRFVDEEGGPYSRHLTTEQEQRTFDSTCKKLFRFLIQRPATNKHS